MKHPYQIGDRVVVVAGQFQPVTLEVIDIDGLRTQDGTIQVNYLLNDGRHYQAADMFRSATHAKADYAKRFERVLARFDETTV